MKDRRPPDKLTEEEKQWIDNATYEELLRAWRFEYIGTRFYGKYGNYFFTRLHELWDADPETAAKISLDVGW